jgi:hypothetical protein
MPSRSVQLRILPGEESSYLLDIYFPSKDPGEPRRIPVTREKHAARNRLIRENVSKLVSPISTHLDLTEPEKDKLLLGLSRQGALAFEEMFPKGSKARSEIIHALSNPEVTTIKVYARGFSIPWELLSPEHPSQSNGRWQRHKMWGEQFIIQRFIPLGGRREDRHRSPGIPVLRPRVSLAAYREWSHIQKEIDHLVQLKASGVIDLKTLEALDRKRKEMEMLVVGQFFRERADIAHFACHLSPHECAGGSALLVSDYFEITPDDFRSYGIRFSGSPLVILNACESGILHPLQEGGFVSTFLEHSGGQGVIATDCEVPSLFATAFARQFYELFVRSNKPIGLALLETRQKLIESHNNPLALLYGLYQIDPDTYFIRVPSLD